MLRLYIRLALTAVLALAVAPGTSIVSYAQRATAARQAATQADINALLKKQPNGFKTADGYTVKVLPQSTPPNIVMSFEDKNTKGTVTATGEVVVYMWASLEALGKIADAAGKMVDLAGQLIAGGDGGSGPSKGGQPVCTKVNQTTEAEGIKITVTVDKCTPA